MDIDRVAIRLRPRAPWEAVDLGIAMVRTWRRAVLGPWLVASLTLGLPLVWALGWPGLLVFWWLLPLAEAVVLDPLSRAVFGERPEPGATLRAMPRLWARCGRELLLRRLHPARSFALAIGQLEGLAGRAHARRRRILGADLEVDSGLPVVFATMEICLGLSLLALLPLFAPTGLGPDWSELGAAFVDGRLPAPGHRLLASIPLLTIVAVHPLYVAAGFGLYLDRRIRLEGWDLQIAFRRLRRRLETAVDPTPRSGRGALSRAARAGLLALLLAVGLAGLGPTDARARQESQAPARAAGTPSGPPPEAPPETPGPAVWDGPAELDPRLRAREIVARPEFGTRETVGRWRIRRDLIEWLESSEAERPPGDEPHPVLLAIAWTLLRLGEAGLWVAVLAALVVLLVAGLRRRSRPGPTATGPEALFGLDLRPESLPDDPAGEARRLWADGRAASALALLYRATLARLAEEGVRLREGFTEADCLLEARRSLPPPRTDFLADLTREWQRVAYAHRRPTGDGEDWARRWSQRFGGSE